MRFSDVHCKQDRRKKWTVSNEIIFKASWKKKKTLKLFSKNLKKLSINKLEFYSIKKCKTTDFVKAVKNNFDPSIHSTNTPWIPMQAQVVAGSLSKTYVVIVILTNRGLEKRNKEEYCAWAYKRGEMLSQESLLWE